MQQIQMERNHFSFEISGKKQFFCIPKVCRVSLSCIPLRSSCFMGPFDDECTPLLK